MAAKTPRYIPTSQPWKEALERRVQMNHQRTQRQELDFLVSTARQEYEAGHLEEAFARLLTAVEGLVEQSPRL